VRGAEEERIAQHDETVNDVDVLQVDGFRDPCDSDRASRRTSA
jgi:hypothetical protein